MFGDTTMCEGTGCPFADKCYRNALYKMSTDTYKWVFRPIPYDSETNVCERFIERD